MATIIPEVQFLINVGRNEFEKSFLKLPFIASCAPGRVNLIGEHTDYNLGYVLPVALPLVTVVVGRTSSDPSVCRIKSLALSPNDQDIVEFGLPSDLKDLQPSEPHWANYVKGVISNFHGKVTGFDAVIISSVPLGGGLSSSASLEVAVYTFLEALSGSTAKSQQDKALACQKAEHNFAKVPCGIMDQFVSTMAVEGNALLIDCRSLESTLLPLSDSSIAFVIINSGVNHALSASEYPLRRSSCLAAARIMNKESLRDATPNDLEAFRDKMDEAMVKRVRHVITEIDRTIQAAQALKSRDYMTFGKLMKASHDSLKIDYEVSCPELDELVDIAMSVPGVYGSRMTGGGFGGCTVTLVREDTVDTLIALVKEKYSKNGAIYVCSPSDGAKVVMNETASI